MKPNLAIHFPEQFQYYSGILRQASDDIRNQDDVT